MLSKASATVWETMADISILPTALSKVDSEVEGVEGLALDFGWGVAQRLAEIGDAGQLFRQVVVLLLDLVMPDLRELTLVVGLLARSSAMRAETSSASRPSSSA